MRLIIVGAGREKHGNAYDPTETSEFEVDIDNVDALQINIRNGFLESIVRRVERTEIIHPCTHKTG